MSGKIVVTVSEGKVRGFKTKAEYSGVEYYTFLGIPYAQSTAGTARFKDPVEVKPWKNILDATVEKGGCIQFSLTKGYITGSEDCLYNNIYTPKIPSNGDALKAVMVCLHPGAMFHGSPDPSYFGSPDYIMHHDVVYVCIGFRINVFGHLNLNLKNCSGNQAIKDIILSMRWIKENIHVFGGDPNNITLMGSSRGSAYVHLLLLSPLAKGLYHKAILMGMYAFNPLLIHYRESIVVADDVACSLGYDGEPGDRKKLLNFYRKLDSIRLITARTEKCRSRTTLEAFPSSPFTPAGEPSENSPIPLSPEELIPSTNRVPLLVGFCQNEGAMGIAQIQANNQSIAQIFYKCFLQNCWGWAAELSDNELKSIQKEVENFYLRGFPIETASKSTLCNILTDVSLSDVYDSLINVIAKDEDKDSSSVYVYNFHYNGNLDGVRAKITELMKSEIEGPYHGADFCYWAYIETFGGKHLEQITPNDRQVIDTITSLLTKFAKTGDPNHQGLDVNWKPTTPEHPSHLIINKTLEVRDEVLNGERLEFWHTLKKKFKKNCN